MPDFDPIANIRPECDSSVMDDENGQFEIIEATGPDDPSSE